MPTAIPNEIKHFEFVIDKLSEFDSEELTDDNPKALGLVEKAIQPIIAGMTDSETIEVLKQHYRLLEDWLQQPELSDSPAFFIQGSIFGMLAYKYGDISVLMGDDE